MLADLSAVEGGFEEPVFDGQAVFRAIMNAFAEPGTLADLGDRAHAPSPLCSAAAALLAALADGDTPVWLPDPEGTGTTAAQWLRFQTGAPIVSDPGAATFAVLPQGDDPAGWTRFSSGTPAYPDRGATLILPVAALEGGATLVLTGPGIATERRIAPRGLPAGFLDAMSENRSRFPLGLDLVLVCGAQALALPRTIRIREA